MDKRFDYLKNAELAQEGNYNMMGDGLLNNMAAPAADLTDGQSYDEMRELAPESLPEEKQSVLDRLSELQQQAPLPEHETTAQQTNEREL